MQGILLTIAAKAYPFLQMVHSKEMVFPNGVQCVKQHNLLKVSERLFANKFDLFLICIHLFIDNSIYQRITRLHLIKFGLIKLNIKLLINCILNCLFIPLLWMTLFINICETNILCHILNKPKDHIPQPFLTKYLPPICVNNLPLLVHYIVIFKKVFSYIKIMRFYLFLRILNSLCYKTMFNGHILFHSKLIHDR